MRLFLSNYVFRYAKVLDLVMTNFDFDFGHQELDRLIDLNCRCLRLKIELKDNVDYAMGQIIKVVFYFKAFLEGSYNFFLLTLTCIQSMIFQ